MELTCLGGFDHMAIWSLAQGHIAIFRLVFERFVAKVEFEFSVLLRTEICMLRNAMCMIVLINHKQVVVGYL